MQEVLTFSYRTTYFFEPSKLFDYCISEYYGSIIIFLVWLLLVDCSTSSYFVCKLSKSLIALLISIHRLYMCILQKNKEYWLPTLYEKSWAYECHFIFGFRKQHINFDLVSNYGLQSDLHTLGNSSKELSIKDLYLNVHQDKTWHSVISFMRSFCCDSFTWNFLH